MDRPCRERAGFDPFFGYGYDPGDLDDEEASDMRRSYVPARGGDGQGIEKRRVHAVPDR